MIFYVLCKLRSDLCFFCDIFFRLKYSGNRFSTERTIVEQKIQNYHSLFFRSSSSCSRQKKRARRLNSGCYSVLAQESERKLEISSLEFRKFRKLQVGTSLYCLIERLDPLLLLFLKIQLSNNREQLTFIGFRKLAKL